MHGYDSYDFHARQMYPAIMRFTSPDPHMESYYSISPYAYCANNPIRFIDPTGMDIWEMSYNGRTNWISESEQHIMYALGKDGKRTGKSLTMENRKIFDDLVYSGLRSDYDASFSIGGESSQNDMLKVFKFAADNTNVEWRVDKFNTGSGGIAYSIGTIHNIKVAITSERMGHATSSVAAFIHSHPDVSRSGELGSMGFRPNDIPIRDSDMYSKTNSSHYRNALYYTYFPESGNVWSVRSGNAPAFIRNVTNYKGFFWGTLNTR